MCSDRVRTPNYSFDLDTINRIATAGEPDYRQLIQQRQLDSFVQKSKLVQIGCRLRGRSIAWRTSFLAKESLQAIEVETAAPRIQEML